ncbi:hypothetical protein MMC21_007201 [Puttea exsequens]|nr:hypothetical protein [Puttea exsequens]
MPMYRGLTKALKHEGYQERRDLFGAPYDFRMAADGLEQGQPGPGTGGFTGPHLSRLRLSAQTGYYADLKQLIEHAVEINSSRLATLVAHSQGALVALYFMAKQPSRRLPSSAALRK